MPLDQLEYLLAALGYVTLDNAIDGETCGDICDQVRADATAVPGDASSSLIAPPAVMPVVRRLIGALPLLENVRVFRGSDAFSGFHMPEYPTRDLEFFKMRISNGEVRTGVVRVWYIIENPEDMPVAYYVAGSHRAELPLPEEFLSPESIDGPAYLPIFACVGSAVVILDPLLCAIPFTEGYRSRLIVECTYSHPTLAFTRNIVAYSVRDRIPANLHVYLRDSWQYDYSVNPPRKNRYDRFLELENSDE